MTSRHLEFSAGGRVAVVDADRLRHCLASAFPSRAEVVAEAEGWSVSVPGLPVAAAGATFDDAVSDVVDALREYTDDWQARLRLAPDHQHNWALVQLIALSDDRQLTDWLVGGRPEYSRGFLERLLSTPFEGLEFGRRSYDDPSDGEDLYLTAEHHNVTARLLTALISSDEGARAVLTALLEIFPWARHLSAEEVREFAVDLVTATSDAVELDAHSNLHRVIVEWRATARILADPELTAQLTTPLPDEDHGEVPAP